MDTYFTDGAVRRTDAVGNVMTIYYNADSKDSVLTELNYLETDTMRMFISADRQLERIWTSKASGTMYPITQVPPDKLHLGAFEWFDYIRPLDKNDILSGEVKGWLAIEGYTAS